MRFGKATRITLIIASVVLVLGLAGLSVLSGAELDLNEILKTLGAGCFGAIAGFLGRGKQ
jgi:hypothetical protein